MAGYGTVLVCTDMSEPSTAALRHAAMLADATGGSLIVCYVVEDPPPAILAHTEDVDDLLQRHRDAAGQALDKYVTEHLSGRRAERVIREGPVHDQIVRLAREKQADVIVVGMHGHGFLAHALMGSTAERVLHDTPCPVLVVPHDS